MFSMKNNNHSHKIKIMWKKISKTKPLLIGGLFFTTDMNTSKRGTKLFIENDWNRVKAIFKTDDHGNQHPEMTTAINRAQLGFFGGALLGGYIHSREKIKDHLHFNDTTGFLSKHDAHKQLFNQTMIGFGKGIFKVAPPVAIFVGSYSLLSSCIVAYRNKNGIIEYTIGGSGIGAFFKFNHGLKGMISGAIIGGILGTLYGTLEYCILKLSGIKIHELRDAQFALQEYREQLKREFELKNSKELTGLEKEYLKLNSNKNLEVGLGESKKPKIAEGTIKLKESQEKIGENHYEFDMQYICA